MVMYSEPFLNLFKTDLKTGEVWCAKPKYRHSIAGFQHYFPYAIGFDVDVCKANAIEKLFQSNMSNDM